MATRSIPESGNRREGDRTTRCQRGIALFRERGDEIVAYVSGEYGVPSRTEEDVIYHVDLESDERRCQCPDYLVEVEYRGNPYHICLHQFCAMVYAAKVAAGRKGPGAHRTGAKRSRCSGRRVAA